MHSVSSKYRKPKGRLSNRRAACIRNLEKGKSSACNSLVNVIHRSISDFAMRYTTILCDDDAKTHQHLNEKKCMEMMSPSKKKSVSVNHVAKRLGTALRNKVKEWRVKGVTIGGRKQDSLTDNYN
ncbi:hypothetical protein TNCV_3919021 [Trichonephila clavipes]|nr:hypothetical protein TNCV_3919021 [Trichonephila clavipes]